MSKQQLIEAIRHQNRSATETFLTRFDESALSEYLNHLQYGKTPRSAKVVWIRNGQTPAIIAA